MGRRRKLPIIQEVKEKIDYSKYSSGLDLDISLRLDKVFEEIDQEFYSSLESNDPEKIKASIDLIKPRTYDDCLDAGWGTKENPCPFFSCKNNLFLDITEDGEIKYIHKKKDFDQIQETCLNRAIENGPLDFKQISELIGVVRERARQIKNEAKEKIKQTTEFKKMEGLIFVNDEEENNPKQQVKTNVAKKTVAHQNIICDEKEEPCGEKDSRFDFVLRDRSFSVEKPKKSDKTECGTRKSGPTKNEWRKRRFYPGR
jgi:hypothetical protein